MTKLPDINSKLKYATFKAKNIEDEGIIRNLKKLAIQDDLEIGDLLREAIRLLFVQHHLDQGGNPQTTLVNYDQTKLTSLGKCSINSCKLKAAVAGINLLSKKEHRFCKKHYETLPQRHDSKVWQFKEVAT
ncbi:MAG: hypothetical protein ABSB71_07810 [Candidatus Bathyarchaeia archaeon]|jgi:hypothetical protein